MGQKSPLARAKKWVGCEIARQKTLRRHSRRIGLEPARQSTLTCIVMMQTCGKWFASAGGVAIGLVIALVVTVFGAAIPGFSGDGSAACVVVKAAARSVTASGDFIWEFLISGSLGLVAAYCPDAVKFFMALKQSARAPALGVVERPPLITERGAAVIISLQLGVLVLAVIVFVFSLWDVMWNIQRQTPERMLIWRATLVAECEVVPAP